MADDGPAGHLSDLLRRTLSNNEELTALPSTIARLTQLDSALNREGDEHLDISRGYWDHDRQSGSPTTRHWLSLRGCEALFTPPYIIFEGQTDNAFAAARDSFGQQQQEDGGGGGDGS